MSVDTFVAFRYLRPRRRRGLLSVITVIAVAGFAAGVGALVLALAVTNGFRDALQQELVGATAELNLLHKTNIEIAHYPALIQRLQGVPHVRAIAPVVYDEVFLSFGNRGAEATIKGVIPQRELQVGDMLRHVTEGSWRPLQERPAEHTLLLGADLASSLGVTVGDYVDVYVPHAILTPFGYAGRTLHFEIAGIFRSGFSDFDGRWAYCSLQSAQDLHAEGGGNLDSASALEFRLDDIYAVDQVANTVRRIAGPSYATTTWISQNRAIFQALKMERLGTVIVIGLIVFVAAMNVLVMLTMLVMEKRKEIAVLLSMGARRAQIRRIFILQGLLIDVMGTGLGLAIAYLFAWGANRYHWIHISSAVYAIDYVPFHAQLSDGVWVALLSLTVSLLASVYPAQRAVRILPVETLRYE